MLGGILMNLTNDFAYLDFFAATVILIIFLALIYKKAYLSHNGKSLMIISSLIFILTLFEGFTHFFDNSTNRVDMFLNQFLNYILFLVTPIFLGFWAKYSHYLIHRKHLSTKHLLLFFMPTIIVTVLITINLFTPLVYNFDALGTYTRLSGFIYVAACSYVLVIYSLAIQLISLVQKFRFEIGILLIGNIVAFFGSFIQLSHSTILSFYTFSSVGFIIVYVFFESIEDSVDHLTNLFNRRKIYDIIESKILSGKTFSLVSLDLDYLKNLNDEFGHHIGDQAIIDFSRSLHMNFTKEALIGRIGGDEFVLVSELPEDDIINRLDGIDPVFQYNSNQYEYGFSYGVSHSRGYTELTVDGLLKEADQKMYEMKAIHKNYKRRSNDK